MATEQRKCHEWTLDLSSPDGDGEWIVYLGGIACASPAYKHCPTCGTKLNADGTEQALVAAVAPEAVRATWFFAYLSDVGQNTHIDENRWDDLVGLGLAHDGPPDITDQGRVILAALQQAGAEGPSAEEMLDALDDEYRRKCDWEDGLDENVTRWRETPRQHARALIAQKEAPDVD